MGRFGAGRQRLAAAAEHGPGRRVPRMPLYGAGGKPHKYSDELWEQPRQEVGLKLLGELCQPDPWSRPWTYVLQDESRRSYVGYLAGLIPSELCMTFFVRIRDGTMWKQPVGNLGPIPRKTAWMVCQGCLCPYRYGSLEVEPVEYPPWMIELMELTMPRCGVLDKKDWPNSCNLNLYEDGGMSVGWHSDDERLFQGKFQDIRIISLSFGARRRFEVRPNWPNEGEQPIQQLLLGDGDMCTMEGMMQKHYQHRIPREGYVQGPRINLTWRWTLKHVPQCPATRQR